MKLLIILLIGLLGRCYPKEKDHYKRSYFIKSHPFLKETRLSKEMLDLMRSKDATRNKRQYILYRQNVVTPPTNLNSIQISDIVNPVQFVTNHQNLDNVISSSPQYIVIPAQEPIKNSVDNIVAGVANMPNIQIQPASAPPSENSRVNDLITLAANSAIQTELNFKNLIMTQSTANQLRLSSTESTRPLVISTNVNTPKAIINPARAFPNLVIPIGDDIKNLMKKTVTNDPIRIRANIPEGETCEAIDRSSTTDTSTTKDMKYNVNFVMPTSLTAHPSMNNFADGGGNTSSVEDTLAAIKTGIGQLKYGRFNGEKEGMPCSLKGSWKSAEAGVQFNITELKEGGEVDVPIRAINDQTGFFNQCADWSVSVLIPFPKLSLMIVTAVHENTLHMATFSGECRVCDGRESISGHWLLVQNESSCEDMNRGQEFFGDIWTRCG